jgi:hypothetical protein
MIPVIHAAKQFDQLEFQLMTHGRSAATLRTVRGLALTPLWLQTRILLQEHGFTEAEIAYLMGIHPPGCPCWQCVRALHIQVRNHRLKMRARRRKARVRPKDIPRK